jgi:HTH-type transcriptional regulator/antitoxin HipB
MAFSAPAPQIRMIMSSLYFPFISLDFYIAYISQGFYNEGMDTLLLQSPSQLSLHLKSLRKSRRVTQADMAKRLAVTQERYSQIERNPELIATGRLLEILAVLGVDVLLKLRPTENARRPTPTPTPTRRGEDW